MASTARNTRYDCSSRLSPARQFGLLYLAYDLATCWMETVVRTNTVWPAGTNIRIPVANVANRWACEISARSSLVLVQFADEPLIDLGECALNNMGDSYLSDASRTIIWPLVKQMRVLLVPLLHALHRRLAAQR